MKVCSVDGCGKKHDSHGYCSRHAHQYRRHGKILERTKRDKNNILICGDIAVMDLYNKKCEIVAQTIFDAQDCGEIEKYKWKLMANGYVYTAKISMYLHRFILDNHGSLDTDHINGNKRDNRRCNLRLATRSQNIINSGKRSDNTSGYTGVYYQKENKKWVSLISVNKENINLGSFENIEQAAQARREASIRYYGEFAYGDNSK